MTDQYVEYGKSTLTVKNDRVLVYEFIVETAQHSFSYQPHKSPVLWKGYEIKSGKDLLDEAKELFRYW